MSVLVIQPSFGIQLSIYVWETAQPLVIQQDYSQNQLKTVVVELNFHGILLISSVLYNAHNFHIQLVFWLILGIFVHAKLRFLFGIVPHFNVNLNAI